MGSLSQTKPKPSEAVFLLHPTSSHVPSVFIFTQSLRGQHYFDDGDSDDNGDHNDFQVVFRSTLDFCLVFSSENCDDHRDIMMMMI